MWPAFRLDKLGVREPAPVVLLPYWPWLLSPHIQVSPSAVWAAEVPDPPATTLTRAGRPVTGVGVVRSVMVPSPSWPLVLAPHAHSAPLAPTARLWVVPAATNTTVPIPATNCGVTALVVVPLPSWPLVLVPQVHKV